MPDTITGTERFIRTSGLFGRRKAILTGRGATALMLLFETMTQEGGRVILPAIGCPSILASVLLTGRKPVVVDVDRNLNVDPGRVEETVRQGDLVLAIHIFGIPCEIVRLERICRERGAVLVEDAAQAVGGRLQPENRPVGTFGRASILSFAEGKILPTHGGGLILADDKNLLDGLRERTAGLPKRPADLAHKARKLRDALTDAFNEARRDNPRAASRWVSIFREYPDVYYYSIEPEEASEVAPAMRELEKIAEDRRRGVEMYRKHLDVPGVETLDYPDGCSPWRYTFLLPKLSGTEVQGVTEAIRSEGMHASNLYLPLHWLAPDEVEHGPCPRAEMAGIRTTNLWLEDGIPERDAAKVAEIVSRWTN